MSARRSTGPEPRPVWAMRFRLSERVRAERLGWKRRSLPTGARWQNNPAIACRLDWAFTETNLGAALVILGEREKGTARLEEAVAALHER